MFKLRRFTFVPASSGHLRNRLWHFYFWPYFSAQGGGHLVVTQNKTNKKAFKKKAFAVQILGADAAAGS